MSKKIASGAHTILLDVKFGHGAFMKTVEEATVLAKTMVTIGHQLGKDTQAILTDMNQPLGNTIGNRLEVLEAIETLKGRGPDDLTTLCVEASAIMLVQGNQFKSIPLAKAAIQTVINNGKAYQQFEAFVSAQGGDLASFLGSQTRTPRYTHTILSNKDGFIQSIDALALGKLALLLGAGRLTKEDGIDEKAGLVLHKKPGESLTKGDSLLDLFSDKPITSSLLDEGLKAFTIDHKQPKLRPIIEKHITL
jgi:pyrimidine-nucleoside phosphorylase